jgi:hypothetical protein
MAKVIPIPEKPTQISSEEWTTLLLLRKNLDDWRISLAALEKQYDRKRRSLFARLLAGAEIENSGRIDV